MKIRVINPNDSEPMRTLIAASCASVAAATTELEVCCGGAGVASIEGFHDGALAAVGVLQQVGRGEAEGVDGYLIACADDTALQAARERANGPVVGIGEAAMHSASLLGCGFSILTAQQKSIPALEQNAHHYGFAHQCRGVHAIGLPVLDLEHGGDPALLQQLTARGEAILQNDRSEVLVLGCAGLTALQPALQQALGIPVIDGVRTGLLLVQSLLQAGLRTSKRNGYRYRAGA